jgi:hypothetical protein
MRGLLRKLAGSAEVPLLQDGPVVVNQPSSPFVLRVLVVCRDGQFLAQGIEFDLNAQAPSEKQAVQSYLRILRARAKYDLDAGREPLAGVPPAPKQYIDAWAQLEEQHRQNSESFPADAALDPLGNQIPAYVIHAIASTSINLDVNC